LFLGKGIFDLLLKAGADPYKCSVTGSVMEQKGFGRDPLAVGISTGNFEV